MLERLSRLPEENADVLLIGHNPGLHDLAIALARPDTQLARAMASGKFPTAARVSLSIAATWADIGQSRHPVIDYVTSESLSKGKK